MSAYDLKSEVLRRLDRAERDAMEALAADTSDNPFALGRRQGEIIGLRTARVQIEEAHQSLGGFHV